LSKNHVDFTNCRQVDGRAYNGANGKKIAVEYNGDIYMIKFPPLPSQRELDLSYTNSCISEYVCCHIFNSIGITAQETLLGTFTVKGSEKIVCACRDFTENNKTLLDFTSIKNTVLDSESNGKGTELEDVLEAIKFQKKVNATQMLHFYFDMFVVDALVANFDRHNGNFGFLFNRDTNKYEIAPVYDCGSCLLPQADDEKMQEFLTHQGEFNSRIFNFPQSMIRENNVKINYYDFIASLKNEHCNEAIKRIVPRIDFDKIFDIIDNTPFISETRKTFYKTFIKARHDIILQPAFEQLVGISSTVVSAKQQPLANNPAPTSLGTDILTQAQAATINVTRATPPAQGARLHEVEI
jgi:hypothetical protein